MAPTTMPNQRTTTPSPFGRNIEEVGWPMNLAELLGALKSHLYVAGQWGKPPPPPPPPPKKKKKRGIGKQSKDKEIVKARKAVNRPFQSPIGKISVLSVLSLG